MRRLATRRISLLHPFLFAAFFILALYASNKEELAPSDLLIPLIITLAVTLTIFLLILV